MAPAPIPKQHLDSLSWAQRNVGQHEQPMGSNTGPFVRSCQAATWLSGTRWPWCIAFWVKAWRVAGVVLPYLGAGAYATLDWYRKHLPGWVVPASRARPGALVIFNIGTGHGGMLSRPFAETDPWIETVDGNIGDKVSRNRRHISNVRGVIDPPEAGAPPAPPVKKPVFEVVTSASGHTKVVYVSGSKAISRKLGAILNRYGGVTIRRRKR
jgi:hypothetical protein